MLCIELGVKKPDFHFEILDDCLTGPRYMYVIDNVVYKYSSDKIHLRWQTSDNISLVLCLLDWEFNNACDFVDDEYKVTFLYDGVDYGSVDACLIHKISTGPSFGVFRINKALGYQRSQIILIKCPDGCGANYWQEVYNSVQNKYLR